MKRTRAALLVVLGACCCTAQALAQPPPGYYDSAQGLYGEDLKLALYDIISPHTVHTNAQLWGDFASTDRRADNPNLVWDIYSDNPSGAEPYVYTFGADQCGTYDSEGDCFNREHTVPQSWFESQLPMVTDLFHVMPTDGWVNQKRGDLPYGLVGGTDYLSQNGTRTGNSITPGYGGTVCEPIDAFKGDIARNYFYMMTRYYALVDGWSGDMLQGGDLSPWAEQLLVSWHLEDPVSSKETDRNNAIFAIQDNRNPYIDHPEWVERIWGETAGISTTSNGSSDLWIAGNVVFQPTSRNAQPATLQDATGRVVWSGMCQAPSFELPVELRSGWYLLRSGPRSLSFVR